MNNATFKTRTHTTTTPRGGCAYQDRRHRLRQPGPRPRTEPARIRLRRGGRPASGRPDRGQGAGRRLHRESTGRSGEGRRPGRRADPGHGAEEALRRRAGAEHEAGRGAVVRARPERALRHDQAARGPGRGAGRAEGPGRAGAPRV
ncbi:hypothetical protein G6F57_020580 [Rhizopus arrhizus]|nr:hypothetical protein G6F57_020580 [Rhizopus arrhizus]